MKLGKENLNSAKTGQRSRYWSLMLVGEHGRVIPFKHFKGTAIAIASVMVLVLGALVVLSIAYTRQSVAVHRLQAELKDAHQQAAKLRDEKDLLMAKLVVTKEIPENKVEAEPATDRQAEASDQTAPATSQKGGSSPAANVQAPTPPVKEPDQTPPVKAGADIKQFKVTYDGTRNILKASFRVYNVSTPKAPLSGRGVVIFKQQDDPPLQWLSVPRVPLADEKPSGKQGQAFKINNYRTMEFKAYGLKPPIRYNTAVAFVFSAAGEMLISEERSFKIDYQPPPKPEVKTPPVQTPPKGNTGQQPAAPPVQPASPSGEDQGMQPAVTPQLKGLSEPAQPASAPAAEANPPAPEAESTGADQEPQPDAEGPDHPAQDGVVDQNPTNSPVTPAKSQSQGERE